MKKIAVCLSLVLIAAAVIFAVITVSGEKTDMNFVKDGTAVFKYDKADVEKRLPEQDLNSVIKLFDDKKLYRDSPSCGFTEDVSIRFNDSEIFCIACDTCPVIYWKNKDLYLRLSDEEYSLLTDILKKFGYVFPCV